MRNEEPREPMTPEEREMEAALSRLRPVRPALGPAAIPLEAARRLARTQLWAWRGAAAALAAGLLLALVLRPEPRIVEKTVYRTSPPQGPSPQWISDDLPGEPQPGGPASLPPDLS